MFYPREIWGPNPTETLVTQAWKILSHITHARQKRVRIAHNKYNIKTKINCVLHADWLGVRNA